MADMTNLEQQQVDRANASGLKPVVFVRHGWPEVAQTALDFIKEFG
ncbi:hypothetical protein [Arthrobacter sp. NicSoilC12]|nr:hypothetical protein [Arthrobacter sp. NicSoilC12]